ncbi:MAG TPA: condensation domain-containing protein, partial [Candidatus Kapabacteria bacterium]|nr:condensation domain-containing protein [Candidatus Kapabacteria bacterium]
MRIHNGQLKILHMYGPTENTTFSTFFPVEKEYKNTIPLGKPIGNSTVYILNKNNRVQPIGIPGEICVGGAGITRGYLNNPELTAEKFSTFLKESDAIPSVTKNRLYRTGDLGKWNREGNIEFLGREDHQVKIRGFRIELGEIETQLLKHESVKEALVLHREKGSGASGEDNQDIFLCAYIVLRDAGTPDRRTLRPVLKEYLAQGLPDYMIPDFVFLDKFPLTHNGKLDKRALPDPELIPGEEYIAPRDIIEEKLVAIWSDVLDRNSPGSVKIGIDDNFFDLGGHSLKATILASKIHKVFDVKIQLVEIFKMPKIRELANYIKEKNKEIFVSIEPAEKKEYYLLSSAQKRLYVLQRMNPEIISYNIPEIIPLPVESDLQKIEATFRKLIKRHESLRTSFHMINDTPVQVVHDHVAFKADLFDLKDTQNPRDYITRFISPFDLTQAPLIRTGLLKEAGKRCILIVDMHHVISDGSSHEILLNDFLSLYQGKDLPPLPVQYKDFSEWQNGEKETENLKRQEEYWLKEFAGEIPVLELPIDFPRPVEQSFEGNIVEFEISAAETRALNAMAITGGATLFMVLVAVLNVLLANLSN